VDQLDFAADVVSGLLASGEARAAPKAPGNDATSRQIAQAAKDFESILLNKLLAEMKKSVPESGLFETSTSGQMRDIFWMFLARDLADKGGIGLWKEIHRQMQAAAGRQAGESAMEQLR